MATRNNNIYGKQRKAFALAELAKSPWTARQLCKRLQQTEWAFGNIEGCRKLLKKLEDEGLVFDNGYVNLDGFDEKFWFTEKIPKSKVQHEGEISEMLLGVTCIDFRRLYDVDQELRPDVELETALYGTVPWEHESSGGTNIKQIKEKFERYGDRLVLWTCNSKSHLDKLCRFCPSDKHLFTTFDHVMDGEDPDDPSKVVGFHGDIWTDKHSNGFTFPSSVQSSAEREPGGTHEASRTQ